MHGQKQGNTQLGTVLENDAAACHVRRVVINVRDQRGFEVPGRLR